MAMTIMMFEEREVRIRRLAQRLVSNPDDTEALQALAMLDQTPLSSEDRQVEAGSGRTEHYGRDADLEFQLKSEVVAMVSHELRTPLATVKAYVELVLEGLAGDLTHQQIEFLTIADESVDRLAAMVTDLLDAARLEAGRLELKCRWLDLTPTIRRLIIPFKAEIAVRRQTLDVRVPPSLPVVWADPDRMTQVLANLLSNAIKYTPDGGHLTITAAAEVDSLSIQVSDTGIGLSDEDRRHIFAKFYRARQPEYVNIPGVGLGLTICRTLVELHGGQITVESTLGQGSIFTVRLPRQIFMQPVRQSA